MLWDLSLANLKLLKILLLWNLNRGEFQTSENFDSLKSTVYIICSFIQLFQLRLTKGPPRRSMWEDPRPLGTPNVAGRRILAEEKFLCVQSCAGVHAFMRICSFPYHSFRNHLVHTSWILYRFFFGSDHKFCFLAIFYRIECHALVQTTYCVFIHTAHWCVFILRLRTVFTYCVFIHTAH
jgi:hypothetical protein